ncbi:MAG TPA: hypothetical protein VMT55_05290 [Candidatus Sulfotelmatobacter sp.]|nr:hypothetical protein [Candidatus Sulfotelmatobacter sp.]
MTDGDPLIRMRAADAAEKVSSKHPEYLQPFKARLLNKVAMVPQQEVRWHTAQMLAYLTLTPKERDRTARLLFSWIENEKSNIVKVLSLQALAGFAQQDKYLRSKVVSLLNKFVADGSPSLKSRSKKILKEFAARKPGKT